MSHRVQGSAQLFIERASKFSEDFPKEGERLYGELLTWGLAVMESHPLLGNTAEVLSTQLASGLERVQNKESEFTMEALIDSLFSKNPQGEISAEIIVGRLQLL
jgi:hypothetical protein